MKKQRHFLNFLIILLVPLLFTACPGINVYEHQLNVPKNLKVSSITSEGAVISWTPVKQAEFYEVSWFKGNSDTGGSKYSYQASVQLDGLDYDETYKILVRAMPNSNKDELIPSEYVQISFKTKEDVTPAGEYARPGNIKLTLDDAKKYITITWDPVEDAVYYDISLEYVQKYSYMPDQNAVIQYTVSASQTSITVSNRALGQTVQCKVAARNSTFGDTCRWSKPVALKL